MSSQHLSDYEKQLLADPTYTCIVKVKGVGAGAHTVTPILKTVFAKMQKEYNEGGGIREVGDWQEIGSNAILKQDKVYVPVKTPQEILDEAMGLVQQSTPKVAEEVVTKKSEAKATK